MARIADFRLPRRSACGTDFGLLIYGTRDVKRTRDEGISDIGFRIADLCDEGLSNYPIDVKAHCYGREVATFVSIRVFVALIGTEMTQKD
jgi:hypothetical protein